jgi:hypothetical protein
MRILICISCLISLRMFSQVNVLFTEAEQLGNEVRITWTMGPGNTCDDLEIMVSTDNVNFSTFYTHLGICGNTNSAEMYQISHIDPACDRINYYRIISRGQGTLNSDSLDVVCYNNSGIKLQQSGLRLTILADTDVWQDPEVRIVDGAGKLVFNASLGHQWEVILPSSGLYIISTTSGSGRTFTSKIICTQ